MVVVLREAGLRFIVFKDDHEPAHVHVIGDGDAKITLVGANGMPQVVYARDMKRSVLSRALKIVRSRQTELIEKWNAIHG